MATQDPQGVREARGSDGEAGEGRGDEKTPPPSRLTYPVVGTNHGWPTRSLAPTTGHAERGIRGGLKYRSRVVAASGSVG